MLINLETQQMHLCHHCMQLDGVGTHSFVESNLYNLPATRVVLSLSHRTITCLDKHKVKQAF